MKNPTSFTLFETKDIGIQFPRIDNGVVLLAEKLNTSLPILGTVPLGPIQYIFAPSSIGTISIPLNQIKSSLGSSKYKIVQNLKDLHNESFIFDSTPYVSSIFNNANPTEYVSNVYKLYSRLINIINDEFEPDIKQWSLVYVFDELIMKDRISITDLYLWFFLKYAEVNNGKVGNGFPFNNIFFVLKKNGTNTITKIYQSGTPIDYNNIKKFLISIKNDIQDINNQPDDNGNNTDSESYLHKILKFIPSLKVPEDESTIKLTTGDIVKAINNVDDTNITKPNINPNNINNFSFLLSRRSPSEQAKAITNDQISVVAKISAFLNNKDKPRNIIMDAYNTIKKNLMTHSKQASEAIGMLKDKKFEAMSVYVNQSVNEYSSKIYPVKPTIQKEVLNQLDKWSEDRGYEKPRSIDPILNANVINTYVHANFHRAMAQKEITWQEMPSRIEELITPVLNDAGFKFLSIMMVDNPPDPKQIEPTYMTDVKIRIQNTKNRKIQTTVFKIPTLIDGKYHISGGIKWLFPNVLATLPIFVIEPGKVQFKTNYSAMTFTHSITSKKDTVKVLVGGVNMSLLVWLLQFKSWDELCDQFGMTYQIITNKREINDSNGFIIKLKDKTKMVVTVSNTDSTITKLSKALLYELQPLVNKLDAFDPTTPDTNASIITALTGRRTAAYSFKKIKMYMIDIHISTILKQRNILPDLYNVSILCAKFSINNTEEDKLGINNVYLRLMDLIPCEIERAFHYALTEYRRRSTIDPDIQLMVNSGWVINALREQAVLLLYKDGNPTIETAQFTAVRLVGPGAFSKTDTVQVKDRRIPSSHFGVIDPIDTAEGSPGIQTYLTSGFEYDPDHKVFTEPEKNNNYTNMFSAAASMIPFVSHDDGNRAQFGCSQTRQVVPVINSEPPIVGTGMEAYLPSYASSKFVKKAKKPGSVQYIDSKCIVLRYDDGTYDKLDIRSEPLQTGSGKANAIVQTPLVKVGDRVSQFQILVKNPFINGAYSSGVNVLAAFKTEEGYSYEDGVVVAESFAKECVSTHFNTIDVSLESPSELKIFPLDRFKETGSMKYNEGETIIKTSISALGGFQDASVIAPTYCEVVDIQIWPATQNFIPLVREIDKALNGSTNENLKRYGLSSVSNINDIIDNIGKFKFRKDELTRTFIRLKVIEYRQCGLGDKVNNRHGNKGVITKIIPDDLMPRTPDGRMIQVCINPLGVTGRMNLGQIYEIHVGNILDKAWRNLLQINNDNEAREMLCQLYTMMDGSKEKQISKAIIQNLKSMGQSELHTTVQYLKDHKIRMIYPAYDNLTIEDLNAAAKFVGTTLRAKLYEPRYKRNTINECTYGMIFMNRLEHIAAIKENTRTVGRYMTTTMMPAKAGAHRNAIRVGEMDSHCLLAQGANTVLKELFAINANNQKAKLKIIGDIENTGSGSAGDLDEYDDSGSEAAFKVFTTTAGIIV